MLRVGLTGGLGSGKSTAARLLGEHGAEIMGADELGRGLMEPGTAVFAAIHEHFGPEVVTADGRLDRAVLARLAFAEGRVEELNAIVHPATIALQHQLAAELFARRPDAILVVESALIFETLHGAGWRDRFDRMILVAAPDAVKIERFITRSGAPPARAALESEARRRLDRQIPDALKAPRCDYILQNDSTLAHLREQVDLLWPRLQSEEQAPGAP